MPLETGRQLGPYEIVSAIGAGGMGEVYKARDTRLDRTVAIKVLPEHVASDSDLKQRFEREAKTISSLNHPHICTLYDIGNQDGIDFLVMEYLEGDTLAQRLEKGALPSDQALKIAVEIADALDKAHRQGITHRDLKPGNIMLTKAGAKLLDFGLAKLKPGHDAPVGVSAPTVSAGLTGEGAILGTLQYMAPEQLEGKEADARTDIFAFGALVYEMVTGRRAFSGDSQASLIAAILDREPVPMSTLHAMTPARLDEIVKTCLAKDPEDRWQSARDVGRLLKEPIGGATQATDPVAAAAGPELHVWQRPIPLVLGIVTTVVATSLVVWSLAPHSSPEVGRFLLTSPESAPLAIRQSPSVALTPDGSRLVYVGERSGSRFGLFVRAMDGFETTLLYEEVTDRPFSPFVSPDGRWVGFSRSDSQTLMRVPVLGGPPETICECDSLTGGVWGADDTIIFGREVAAGGGLWRVVAGGGDPEPLTSPDMGAGERVHLEPEIMPGGKMVLFTIMSDDPNENPQIALLDLDTRDYQLLFPGRRPRYVSTGHIVYSVNGVLWAVGFNLARIAVIGEPTLVLDDTSPSGGSALFAGPRTALLSTWLAKGQIVGGH
jgi:serine/threonine protein kinase